MLSWFKYAALDLLKLIKVRNILVSKESRLIIKEHSSYKINNYQLIYEMSVPTELKECNECNLNRYAKYQLRNDQTFRNMVKAINLKYELCTTPNIKVKHDDTDKYTVIIEPRLTALNPEVLSLQTVRLSLFVMFTLLGFQILQYFI